MNIIDSSVWLEYIKNGKNASLYANIIENEEALLVPTITLTEVFKKLLKERGEQDALLAIAQIEEAEVIELTKEIALEASRYGLLFNLPLADSIIYATAKKYNCTIYTQDSDFEGLENVVYYKC